jgi:hypothetical protein
MALRHLKHLGQPAIPYSPAGRVKRPVQLANKLNFAIGEFSAGIVFAGQSTGRSQASASIPILSHNLTLFLQKIAHTFPSPASRKK